MWYNLCGIFFAATCLKPDPGNAPFTHFFNYFDVLRFDHFEDFLTADNRYHEGAIAQFECSVEQISNGSSSATCQANGTWGYNMAPTCIGTNKCCYIFCRQEFSFLIQFKNQKE